MRDTLNTSAFQSECGSAEERTNLDKPNIALGAIIMILPPNRSINADKLHMLKNAFRPVGKAAMAIDFKNCCSAKGERFRYLNKVLSKCIHGWYIQNFLQGSFMLQLLQSNTFLQLASF